MTTEQKKKQKFDNELLLKTVERDGCSIDKEKYKNMKINCKTKIEFKCKCGQWHEKPFRYCYEKGGMFCSSCTEINKLGKFEKTNLERHGYEYPAQNPESKAKFKETNLKNTGYENPFQNKDIKERIKEINLKNLGVEYPAQNLKVQARMKETNLKNTGFENPAQNPENKAKSKETNLERYGCEHPMQNAEISEQHLKNCHKTKFYIFKNGEHVQCQGYEPFALQELEESGLMFDEIITSRSAVPEIWYVGLDEKKHRYFCDIFLPNDSLIIEVKSAWTLETGKNVIPLKQKACEDAGYKFELWVFDSKGNRIVV